MKRLTLAATGIGALVLTTLGAVVVGMGLVVGESLRRAEPPGLVEVSAGSTRAPGKRLNMILVSVDTLRADHLGCYGYDAPTSPNLDAFAAEATLFETAVAHAPSTLPSHASIFTSLIPAHHGAHMQGQALAPRLWTVGELLARAGYRTGAFHAGGQLRAEFGVDQGFETYEFGGHRFTETVEMALDWLDGGEEPFFLFLHTYEVHHPYTPEPELLALFESDYDGPLPDRISKGLLKRINGDREPPVAIDAADFAHIVATYDAEIRSVDAAFGQLVGGLRERGLWDRSVLVVTSDHGEEFGEHEKVGTHSHSLYDELLLVPLLLHAPGITSPGLRVPFQVRGIDIAPTFLELAGLPPHPQFTGESLLALLDGEGKHRVAVSQRDTHHWDSLGARESALRTPEWKLRERRTRWGGDDWHLYRWSLYDLRDDPGEQSDVVFRRWSESRRLGQAMNDWTGPWRIAEAPPAAISDATKDELRALGYLD